MKKILVSIFTFFFLVSCSSQKSAIQTQKKAIVNTKPSQKINKKPAIAVHKNQNTKLDPIVQSQTKPTTDSSTSGTEILVSTSVTKVTLQTISNYILQYKDIAMGNMQTYGIPASIILAQGILESGAGSGDLATSANNHFGIKCHKDWSGESVRHDDDTAQECFRKYAQASESFQDHALFLTTRGRYANLFKLPKHDYKAWAKGLRSAGYATDPRYPQKLITYIEKYRLQQYDNQVLGIVDETQVESIAQTTTKIETNQSPESIYEIQKGDTLYSLSKKFSLTVDELREINNLADNDLSVGQKIKTKKT